MGNTMNSPTYNNGTVTRPTRRYRPTNWSNKTTKFFDRIPFPSTSRKMATCLLLFTLLSFGDAAPTCTPERGTPFEEEKVPKTNSFLKGYLSNVRGKEPDSTANDKVPREPDAWTKPSHPKDCANCEVERDLPFCANGMIGGPLNRDTWEKIQNALKMEAHPLKDFYKQMLPGLVDGKWKKEWNDQWEGTSFWVPNFFMIMSEHDRGNAIKLRKAAFKNPTAFIHGHSLSKDHKHRQTHQAQDLTNLRQTIKYLPTEGRLQTGESNAMNKGPSGKAVGIYGSLGCRKTIEQYSKSTDSATNKKYYSYTYAIGDNVKLFTNLRPASQKLWVFAEHGEDPAERVKGLYCHAFGLLTITQTKRDFDKDWPKRKKNVNLLEDLLRCPFRHRPKPKITEDIRDDTTSASSIPDVWKMPEGWTNRRFRTDADNVTTLATENRRISTVPLGGKIMRPRRRRTAAGIPHRVSKPVRDSPVLVKLLKQTRKLNEKL